VLGGNGMREVMNRAYRRIPDKVGLAGGGRSTARDPIQPDSE
jgi:hypothetical protein